MTFAIVKVFPEPVTPKRVVNLLPLRKLSVNCLIAFPWSPLGLNLEANLKGIYKNQKIALIFAYKGAFQFFIF